MLILTRKRNESIRIGEDIVVRVMRTGKGGVKIGIEAPSSVRIVRGELHDDGRVGLTELTHEDCTVDALLLQH
jgi:carbon storage regulator